MKLLTGDESILPMKVSHRQKTNHEPTHRIKKDPDELAEGVLGGHVSIIPNGL
jgi:hypothetical protein